MVLAVKPQLVWFKAQAPGIRNDGSSMVTMRFATELAKDFNLHLVCLATPSTPADPTTACVPPFATVTVVKSPHQRSPAHRLAFGAWYTLLDKLSRRSMAASIEGSRSVQRAVRERVAEVGADVGIIEYWSAGRILEAMPKGRTTLILLDVEHQRVPEEQTARRALVLNEELDACKRADKVVLLSDEDRHAFASLGVDNGVTVHIPVTAIAETETNAANVSTIVFLGHLDWGPNARGLDWFLQEVWPTVRAHRPDAMLRVIGRAGGQLDGDGVSYLGFVDDLPAALQNTNVGVVPTIDGTGVKTKTLDLLAAGLPIVSTSNGVRGTSASLAGALITNDAEEFASHVVTLLGDSAERERLAHEGRAALLGRHSPNDLASQLLA